jgi:Cof subfamily protein (haloacid dehalogenase superfamily)
MDLFRMICLDIDGTLLNSRHQITPRTEAVIRQVSHDLAIPVILVSARMPAAMTFLQEELGIKAPMICYNGALILDEQQRTLASHTISVDCVRRLHHMTRDEDLRVNYYDGNHWYIEKENEWANAEGIITRNEPEVRRYTDLMDHWTKHHAGPNKILLMGNSESIQAINSKILKSGFHSITGYKSKATYYEIVPATASKSSAIEWLQLRYGLRREQVLAVGDQFNDIAMLEYAGLGIAMGNAPDAVKRHAKAVTLSNDTDGLAVALEEYVLGARP